MAKDLNALSDNPDLRRKQESALENLERACSECEQAGLLLIRQGGQVFAFDEDKLFEAGWNEHQPALRFLGKLGMREVRVYGTVAPNKFADVKVR